MTEMLIVNVKNKRCTKRGDDFYQLFYNYIESAFFQYLYLFLYFLFIFMFLCLCTLRISNLNLSNLL